MRDLENKMILGSAIEFKPTQEKSYDGPAAFSRALLHDEEGQWDFGDGKPHKLWNIKSNNNSLKSNQMNNQHKEIKADLQSMPQLETISVLAHELVDQQANLKDRLDALADRLLGEEVKDKTAQEDRIDNGKFDQIESALRLALKYGSDGDHAIGRLTDQM